MDPVESMFQKDNSRVHTENIIKQLFAKQKFIVLEWPTNSPDLNIIDHVWTHIKYRLNTYEQVLSYNHVCYSGRRVHNNSLCLNKQTPLFVSLFLLPIHNFISITTLTG
jgi:hypothetical protein